MTHPHASPGEAAYVDALLRSYLSLPDTPARARPADRRLAHALFIQAVPLDLVHAAFLVASARRACRQPGAASLGSVRSLHYFLPVIDELRLQPPEPAYLNFLRAKLDTGRRRQ